ncbi:MULTISPECIES: hypothetical protein [Bacillus]|uniref:hypothetical protein n=1 Tax=Bacillus TaxID=1386 RepID=UPI000315C0D3|nr:MULTISPECIES: hypothetical protein [Bacillus]
MSFVESLMLFVVPLTYDVGIVVNLKFPNFDWTNEVTDTIKQSAAFLIVIFAGLFSIVVLVAIMFAGLISIRQFLWDAGVWC